MICLSLFTLQAVLGSCLIAASLFQGEVNHVIERKNDIPFAGTILEKPMLSLVLFAWGTESRLNQSEILLLRQSFPISGNRTSAGAINAAKWFMSPNLVLVGAPPTFNVIKCVANERVTEKILYDVMPDFSQSWWSCMVVGNDHESCNVVCGIWSKGRIVKCFGVTLAYKQGRYYAENPWISDCCW